MQGVRVPHGLIRRRTPAPARSTRPALPLPHAQDSRKPHQGSPPEPKPNLLEEPAPQPLTPRHTQTLRTHHAAPCLLHPACVNSATASTTCPTRPPPRPSCRAAPACFWTCAFCWRPRRSRRWAWMWCSGAWSPNRPSLHTGWRAEAVSSDMKWINKSRHQAQTSTYGLQLDVATGTCCT